VRPSSLRSIRALFIGVAAPFAVACEQHQWEGIVYPKTGQPPFDLVIGNFRTLEECRAAAKAILSKTTPEAGSTPEYECGRDCEITAESPSTSLGMAAMRVCEETAP
jgi:hypothetical protein